MTSSISRRELDRVKNRVRMLEMESIEAEAIRDLERRVEESMQRIAYKLGMPVSELFESGGAS